MDLQNFLNSVNKDEDENVKPIQLDEPKGIDKDFLNSVNDTVDTDTLEESEPEVPEIERAIIEFQETGVVPKGYKIKGPSVPTGTPQDDIPIVKISNEEPAELKLFEYSNTAKAKAAMYAPVDDILYDEAFVVENVPDYLRPFVRVVAQGVDSQVVKPTVSAVRALNTGLTFTGETISDAAAAFTQAVQDGIVEGGTFEKLTGLTGKDLIPFSPKTSGRKFTKDVIDAISVADAPVVGSALAAQQAMKGIVRLTKPDDIIIPRNFDTKAVEGGTLLNLGKIDERALRTAKKGAEKLGLGVKRIKGDSLIQTADMLAKGEKARRAREASGEKTIGEIKDATEEAIQAKRTLAKEEASKNQSILNEIMDAVEDDYGVDRGSLRTKVNGKDVFDFQKIKQLGIDKVEELDLAPDVAYDLGMGPDGFRSPIFNADKMRPLIATIADIKKSNPKAFEGEGNVLEKIFNAQAKGELVPNDELIAMLDKYGISMNDFVLMVIGTGSKEGRGLRQYGLMKEAMGGKLRTKPQLQKAQDELESSKNLFEFIKAPEFIENILGKGAAAFGKRTVQNIRRGENVIRGAMVSAFSTAARNFESVLIRNPLEGMTYVLQETILRSNSALTKLKQGDRAGFKNDLMKAGSSFVPFTRDSVYKDAFATYYWMFGDSKRAKELTDLVLNQPEFAQQLTRYRDQIVETLASTGRGEGGLSDAVFNPIEDFVQFLNTPNRGQEFLSRNAYFLTDLNIALKREWGINFFDEIQKGNIRDIINDSPTLRPTRGNQPPPSFAEIVVDSVESALDKTYASQPRFYPFQKALKALNNIPGSTLAIPFPRFMFKGLEYVYANSPAATVPTILELALTKGNKVKPANRVARNIVGLAALYGIYHYTKDNPNKPEEYNKLRVPGSGHYTNVDPQFPVAQGLYLSRAYEELQDNNLESWLFLDRGRNFYRGVQTLTGSNFRFNQTLGDFGQDISNMFMDDADIVKSQETKKAFAKALGNTLTRVFQPYSMVIDLERSMGMRPDTMKLFEGEPDLSDGSSFIKGFEIPIKNRGYLSPKEEFAAPTKKFPIMGERKRVAPLWKLALGLNLENPDEDWQRFLKSLNYVDFDFQGKTRIGPVDNTHNAMMHEFLPMIARDVKSRQPQIKAQLKRRGTYSKKQLILHNRNLIDNQVKKISEQLNLVHNRYYGDPSIPGATGSKFPEYSKLVNEYRRLNPELKEIVFKEMSSFRAAKKQDPPNLGSINDLQLLILMAKQKKDQY